MAGRIRNSQGYEATDEAFYHSRALVIRIASSGRYPLILIGLKQFIEASQITHQKAPDQAWEFIQFYKDAFWETFQKVMYATVPVGKWDSESCETLFECYMELARAFPDTYQSTEEDLRQLCFFTIAALDECAVGKKGKNQVLIQPVLEVILVVWFHYLFDVWREAERNKLQEN